MEEAERERVLEIQRLVEGLASRSVAERQDSRQQLIDLGSPCTGALLGALKDERQQVRWEAAKVLTGIADLRAAPDLADALRDRDGDVRWVAATALIALGESCLVSVFDALGRHPESKELRERAHHVLKGVQEGREEVVKPVLEALEASSPAEILPSVAKAAYQRLKDR